MNDDYYLGQVFIAMDDAPELGILRGSVSLAIEVTLADEINDPNITFLVMAEGEYERATNFLSSGRLYPFWLNAMEVCKSGEVSPDNSMVLLTTGMDSGHKAGDFDVFYIEEGNSYPMRMDPLQPALLFMGQEQVPMKDVNALLKSGQLIMAHVKPEWLLTTPPSELYQQVIEMAAQLVFSRQSAKFFPDLK